MSEGHAEGHLRVRKLVCNNREDTFFAMQLLKFRMRPVNDLYILLCTCCIRSVLVPATVLISCGFGTCYRRETSVKCHSSIRPTVEAFQEMNICMVRTIAEKALRFEEPHQNDERRESFTYLSILTLEQVERSSCVQQPPASVRCGEPCRLRSSWVGAAMAQQAKHGFDLL